MISRRSFAYSSIARRASLQARRLGLRRFSDRTSLVGLVHGKKSSTQRGTIDLNQTEVERGWKEAGISGWQ